jgi:hypothetical protein
MRDPNQVLRQLLIPLLSVGAGIGVLALLIYWIRIWLRDNDDSAGSAHELLAEYSEMNRRGELTDEEYRIIKSRMAPRIRMTTKEPRAVPSRYAPDQSLTRNTKDESQGMEAVTDGEQAPPSADDEGKAE